MRNLKFKRTLSLFIWMFTILFFFNTVFTWINYYQFKTNSEVYQEDISKVISSDIKNRYESVSTFIMSMDPYVSETVEKSLYSIEREINANGNKIDNSTLESLQKQYNLTNIYVLDEEGIVTYATDETEIGKYSREFYNQEDREKWEEAFKRIIETKEVYVEDKYYRSEIHPHSFHKWGYKGIGYIDGIGNVVLEVGLQVMDIKDKSISPLVEQVVDLNKISENITKLEFINLPPNKLNENFKESQVRKENGEIVTTINLTGLDDSDMQAIITTKFNVINESIENSFMNALIWTVFYAIFSFLICLLMYYRFSIPIQYINKDVLENTLKKINEMKK